MLIMGLYDIKFRVSESEWRELKKMKIDIGTWSDFMRKLIRHRKQIMRVLSSDMPP